MTQRATSPARTKAVLELVAAERRAQEARYGRVNETIEDGTGPMSMWLEPITLSNATWIEKDLRSDYEEVDGRGGLTWLHLVREEIAEAFKESDPERLAEELVQVAALCVSWVERLLPREAPDAPSKAWDGGSW